MPKAFGEKQVRRPIRDSEFESQPNSLEKDSFEFGVSRIFGETSATFSFVRLTIDTHRLTL